MNSGWLEKIKQLVETRLRLVLNLLINKNLKTSILLLSLFVLSSCGELNKITVNIFSPKQQKTKFLGVAPDFSGLLSEHSRFNPSLVSLAHASSCMGNDDVEAELYLLNSMGQMEETPLATNPLGVDGSFEFNFAKLGLNLTNKITYTVKIVGCDIVLIAPVLALGEKQIIDSRLNFIGAAIYSNLPIKLNTVERSEIATLVAKLQGSSLEAVKANLVSNNVASSEYNTIFGITPIALDIAPLIGIKPPKESLPENQPYHFTSTVETVDSSYTIVYEWALDNVIKGTSANWSYIPGKNDQGIHEIRLRAGANNGSGGIDFSRSYFEKSFPITVSNNFSPISPSFSVSSTYIKDSEVIINFDTSDCSTFSSVAITNKNSKNSLIESDFSYTCLDSDIEYLLTGDDGTKVIYLYTKDSAGNISSPTTKSVVLDRTAPILNSGHAFFIGSGAYSGFRNELITWSATDANLGSLPVTIEYSTDFGVSWNEIVKNKSNDGMYSWNLPDSDLDEVRVQITVEDLAGNKSVIASPIGFVIDSTAPLPLSFSIDQGIISNKSFLSATVTSCSADQKFMIIKESSITPAVVDAGWSACVTAPGGLTHTLSAANGLKTLYVWSKDLAGNISAVSNQTITYDTLQPTIALTSPVNSHFINNTNKASISFSGTCTKDGNIELTGDITATINCSGGFFSSALNLSTLPDGNLSFSAKMTDAAGNDSNEINRALTKDTVLPIFSIISPVNSGYIKNSITVTGTCSDEGRNIQVSGDFSASAQCEQGEFSVLINSTSAPEGNNNLIFNYSDDAGNNATSLSRTVNKDTTPPILTQTNIANNSYAHTDSVTFGGSCESGANLTVSGDDSASITCSSSLWSYTVQGQLSDGTFSYTFTHTDNNANTSTLTESWSRDTVKPVMESVLVAEGATYVGTSFVVVDVEATDNNQVTNIRLKNAHGVTNECQSEYADDNWQAYSGGFQRYSSAIIPGDGEKKICVWAKDIAGNVTSFSPVTGILGVNMDTVLYEIGNPPVITAFSVLNNLGKPDFNHQEDVFINWTITDEEELSENPVSLYYTTNSAPTAIWTEIVANYGNIGSGKKSSSGSYLSFKAPSAGFFRVKIIAKDIAGNTSFSTEKTLNIGNWSIFAGSIDPGVGGSALGVRLKVNSNNLGSQVAAINPKNNDAYVVSYGQGIYKLDAVTGKVEMFINHGAKNFVDGDTIIATTAIPATTAKLMFDNNGLLYLIEASTLNAFDAAIIWQINPNTRVIKKYLGGGNLYDGVISSNTAYVHFGAFTFDESNSLYYLAHCSPGTSYNGVAPGTTALRLMKAFQNPTNKNISNINVVAGNCVRGSPTSSTGVTSLDAPLMSGGYPSIGGIAAWENGAKIYYYFLGAGSGYKINNATTYRASVAGQPYYDYQTSKFYFTNTQIYEGVLNFNSSNGDTSTLYVNSNGVGNCIKDGIDRTSACIATSYHPIRGPSGRLAFLDGALINSTSTFSVRYVDENNVIKTYLGTPPFYGDNLDKGFMKAEIGGIHYKQSTQPNLATFPEGLYFVDGSAMVMGHIDTDHKVKILAGNQSKAQVTASDNTDFDKNLSLGIPYSYGGNLNSLVFNNEGLPFMRVSSGAKSLMKVEADNKISFLTASSGLISNLFDFSQEGDDPSRYALYVAGGKNNLTIKNEKKLFLLGAWIHSIDNPTVKSSEMKIFDYENSQVRHLMGDKTLSPASSADDSTGGNLNNKTFASECSATCYLQYNSSDDRIYFSEKTKLRYITTPENLATRKLGTLFTTTRTISNFIFSEDKTQVFYLSTDGKLYCKDISSGKAWCNDTVLGPAIGMDVISAGPNQLTWKNNLTLLISTYKGMIYQYNLFL